LLLDGRHRWLGVRRRGRERRSDKSRGSQGHECDQGTYPARKTDRHGWQISFFLDRLPS
jgi:hypothetical protein